MEMTMTAHRPSDRQTLAALRRVGGLLDCGAAFVRDGRFYFEVSDRWLLALSPDDAGRFRLGACYGATEVATLWVLAEDHDRLAGLVQGLRSEIAALAA